MDRRSGGDDRRGVPAGSAPADPPVAEVGVDLFWLPLGAGGHFVRLNGRVYEAIQALRERRPWFDLYHSALQVSVPAERFTIETAWPIPDDRPASRGVILEGPVGSRWIGRARAFRYEVRRWRDGIIPDLDEAVGGAVRLSEDERVARRVLAVVGSVPALVWGRDELGTGEMWNSNSVVSWILARGGIPVEGVEPPPRGRAPGWNAGLVLAGRERRR